MMDDETHAAIDLAVEGDEQLLREALEAAIQLRDITRTVAYNRYGSSGFANEARIRSDRADATITKLEERLLQE